MDSSTPQTTSAPAASNQSKGFAIAALVLGIIAFVFSWTGFFNLIVAILAVVFGVLALVKHQHKGFALTGLILGGIGLLTSIIFGIVGAAFLAGLSNAANNSTMNSTNSSNTSNTSDSTNSTKTSSWDVNAAYDKIMNGMTKAQVEEATERPSQSCTESQIGSDKYETCTYGDLVKDGASITVSYTNDSAGSKSKSTY